MATGDIPKDYKATWTRFGESAQEFASKTGATYAAAEVASIGPDFMPDAPHDGTPVRAWGKWMPTEGVVLRWKDQVGWCGDQGLACFEMVDRWEAAAEVGEPTDQEANRLYRYLNGLDQDSHDKRAEHIMQQSLDGLHVGPSNRNSTKEILANHFEAVEAATIERCAQACDDGTECGEHYADAIRALKNK